MSVAREVAAARERGALFDLSDGTKLRLTGADRVRYLNGQISQAIRAEPAKALPACVLTAKGRMSSYIHFAVGADAILIDGDEAQREELTARLERYIIADDAELIDVTDEFALFHIFGAAPTDLTLEGAEIWTSERFHQPGTDVWVKRERTEEVRNLLSGKWPLASPDAIELLRIENGVPVWGAELDEQTIPVEAGLDRVAIDYHKGCYIGQETISRLKSIGHVNRNLCGLCAEAGGELVSGMQLESAEGQVVGKVTSAAHSFALARSIALGYVKRGATSDSLLARVPESGPDVPAIAVEVRELPFLP